MSLLKRINQSGGGQNKGGGENPNLPAAPADGGRNTTDALRRSVPLPAQAPVKDGIADIQTRVQNKLVSELDPTMDTRSPEVNNIIQELFETILAEESILLTRQEKQRLLDQIKHEILGFGPLEIPLADDTVTEIMVNGPKNVYVEQKGRLTRSAVTFESNEHVMRILDRIVAPLGRRIDESSPTVDARLPDGSRVNAVIPPIALCGPTITIRKFSKKPYTIEDLIRFGSMTQEIAQFLRACVMARLNVVVSGGTGSGKTTLLNVLSSFIPDDERILTIENAAELQLRQAHVVSLETRPANIEGRGEITIQDLVVNALRMRPDRIVVGECRSGEALDMLQAMNTGHDGSQQQSARYARPSRSDVPDVGHGFARARHPRTDRLGGQPDRSPGTAARRQPQDHESDRSAGHGRRHYHHVRHLRVRADGCRVRQGDRAFASDWAASQVHRSNRSGRYPPAAVGVRHRRALLDYTSIPLHINETDAAGRRPYNTTVCCGDEVCRIRCL